MISRREYSGENEAPRLNAGCGTDVRPGFINLDREILPGVDLVCDLESARLPFRDECFKFILANDVLEHLEYIQPLGELHRILMTGGRIAIRVPHFTSVDNFIDPTHRKLFSFRTFECFLAGSTVRRSYHSGYVFRGILRRYITFRRGKLFYNGVIEALVNIGDRTRQVYEVTGWSRLFPAQNIEVELEK